MSAKNHLVKQFQELTKQPVAGVRVEIPDETDLFKWVVWIRGPGGSPYEGGIFKAHLEFPSDFPFQPPGMSFGSKMWHPNIYDDGRVCISILHPPGEDQYGYEKAEERWSPIQSVESVLISVISMLADPNDQSPANVDAAVMWRKENKKYNDKCKELVKKANDSLPKDFEPPPSFDADRKAPASVLNDRPITANSVGWDEDPGMDEMEDDADDNQDGEYGAQLKQLMEMGAGDKDKCLEVLKQCKGELEKALDILFAA